MVHSINIVFMFIFCARQLRTDVYWASLVSSLVSAETCHVREYDFPPGPSRYNIDVGLLYTGLTSMNAVHVQPPAPMPMRSERRMPCGVCRVCSMVQVTKIQLRCNLLLRHPGPVRYHGRKCTRHVHLRPRHRQYHAKFYNPKFQIKLPSP